MEAIELLAAKGWLSTEIESQERLLPTLRAVNAASLELMSKDLPPVIYMLDEGVLP